jgi:plastocyanin
MSTALKIFINSFYLLFSILLINSCNPGPANTGSEKTAVDTITPEKIIAKSYTVEIKEMKFQPAVLAVQPGDTVVFINHDMVAHDVTDEYKRWTSSPLPAGESWKLVITQTCNYYCSIHQVMKGRLEIN